MSTPAAALTVADIACEPPTALASYLQEAEDAVRSARAGSDPVVLAAALVALARLRFRLGQYAAAQALADEALLTAPERSPLRADAWQVLANCAAEVETPQAAEAYYRLAADIARETGNARAQVAALHGLAAAVYLPCGRFDLALAADAEARRVAETLGRPDWLVYPLITTVQAYQLTGQRALAEAALVELEALVPAGSAVHGCSLCLRGS